MDVQRLETGLLNGSVSQKEAELLNLSVNLLQSIGSGLDQSQQEWLITNIEGLPEFFNTKHGAIMASVLVTCYRQYITEKPLE